MFGGRAPQLSGRLEAETDFLALWLSKVRHRRVRRHSGPYRKFPHGCCQWAILKINGLNIITDDVVEAARSTLVIGAT